ncbi:hypothetical protein A9Q81_07260 [Gammaproteobacteria bacterium 42_54_T18]|nr:hypothetical protein A9Q81_07260 [Gammaproteobacteria bacterium 42_54_T18]
MKQPNIRLPAVFSRSLIQAAAVHSLPIGETLKNLSYDFSTLTDNATIELGALFDLADALVATAPFNTVLPFVKIISYEQIDELMTLMVTGKTMRSCLENIISLIGSTWTPGFTAQYHSTQSNDYLRCDNQSQLSTRQLQFAVEFVFGTFLRVGPLLTGHENIVKEVHFTCDESDAQEYETVFQCPVLFNQQCNLLVLPAGISNKPLASYCPELEDDALVALKKKIAILAKSEGIVTRVTHVLRQLDSDETLNIGMVAKELNVSVRSLQRKLNEMGVTFSAVRVGFLIEQSKALLEQPELTMDRIAERLHFSDRAAFSRAFKRIEGLSPSQYRQQL